MHGKQWTNLNALLNSNSSEDYHNLQHDEAFTKFYRTINSVCHKAWLEETIKESPTKQDSKAETLRNIGNKEYAKGKYKDAINWYTRSLRYATFNDIDYGKALANRSAGSFALEEYEECLKDITACLQSKYPQDLRCKILLRRLQTYFFLHMETEFLEQVHEMTDTFTGNDVFDKCLENFEENKKTKLESSKNTSSVASINMNETFIAATDLIELKYDGNLGRHVVAAKDIKRGDVLFQEKAFVTAQIFVNEEELVSETCYNCLKHIPRYSLPCPSCIYCLFCSEDCQSSSWAHGHRFECPGMIIFYELGCSLIAFKCLMNGIESGFVAADKTSSKFGDSNDMYPWVNSLVMNFGPRQDKMHLLGVAMITVMYLKTKTDFFDHLKTYSSLIFKGDEGGDETKTEKLEIFTGTMLVKHMTQMFCNGSIIQRQRTLKDDLAIAAAIYPSISMMNHSCKSNITIEYKGCIATVKATEDIQQGCEVCNCYGVDHTTDKNTRRHYLEENFGFTCVCPVCTRDD